MTAGEREPVTPPAGLRERVMTASLRVRPAGHAIPEVRGISPAEAFSRAADAFYGLLCALDERAWRLHVLRDLDVQGLAGHLIGVEDDVQRALSGGPAGAQADHVTSTQPAADRQAGRAVAETRADWRRAADRTLEMVSDAADMAAEVTVWGIPLPLSALLVARAFELWTHENDIRQVAGLPASVPDVSTLRLMTELATSMLPLGAALTGLPGPIDLRLVLTGPGGGTWDVVIGGDAPEPVTIAIVTDVVGFCRLAANRASAADLDLHVTGDRGRASGVLAAASALALD
jgi:uncharacterized protein (TIGR03083 family)